MRLTTAPSKWFMAEYEIRIQDQTRFRYEEPFALTNEGFVASPVPILASNL
jgi:hypothetical protein